MKMNNTATRPAIKRIEMKFLLDEELSLQVQSWARDHLGIDQASSSDSGEPYNVNTLYLDTPQRDVLHETGRVGRTKHRIRRYGNESMLWVETKRKKKMVVRKNRTTLFESDFAPQRTPTADDPRCDDWFVERLASRNLQPAVRLAYRRFARTSTINNQNIRLTIDSHMVAAPVDRWSVPKTSPFHRCQLMPFGLHQVLELKFTGVMPVLFKQLLQTFTIPASGFSKYRAAMNAIGAGSDANGLFEQSTMPKQSATNGASVANE